MKGPDAGPETGAPEWSRPQRASEPLPPPPSGYKFAGPDYLYAPRQDEAPAPEPAPEAAAPAPAPAMVWSEARSTWEPAAPPAPAAPPPKLAPPAPLPPSPAPSAPATSRKWSRPPPQPALRRRRRTLRWVVLALVGVCGVNQAISSMRGALPDGGPGPRAVPFPTYSAAPPPAPLPPSPNVTVPAAPPAAPATVADLIGTQILAVRLDNEAMFLGTVDPGAKAARETYKRIFANLHALLAIDFTETLGQSGDPAVGGRVSSPVSMAFCAGGTTTECALTTAHLDVQVGPTAKGVAIEAVTPAVTGSMRAAPWVVTPLTATITGNVLVAGTPTSKAQIAQVTPAAGIAGDRAEAYTLGYVDFRRYVVYLASHADMLAWFGDLDRISYGALDPPVGYDQVVLALPDAMRTGPGGGDGLAADLQRALAKASLTGNDDRPVPVDTLSTGLWAYAAYDGLDGSAPSVDADTLAPVRGFTTGDWAYTCDYSAGNVPLDGITAMPGVGLLAIRFLVDQYGFAAVLRFWDKVERAGEQIENASIEEFNGIPWPEVDSDCASQVAALAGP